MTVFLGSLITWWSTFAVFATQPAKAESDFNIQTSQVTGVVTELRTLSDEAIEQSVKFAEEQEGRENTE
jgi:hypothetical protein